MEKGEELLLQVRGLKHTHTHTRTRTHRSGSCNLPKSVSSWGTAEVSFFGVGVVDVVTDVAVRQVCCWARCFVES